MSNDECIHDMDPQFCSLCKPGPRAMDINTAAVKTATDDLGEQLTTFRTKQIASHPVVWEAHPQMRELESFAQRIGTYLSDAQGTLGIKLVDGSPNATWQKHPPNPVP